MKVVRSIARRLTSIACERASHAADPLLSFAVEACFVRDRSRSGAATRSRHAVAAGVTYASAVLVDLVVPCAGPLVDAGAALAVAAVAAHAVARVAERHPRPPRYLHLLSESVLAARVGNEPPALHGELVDLGCGLALGGAIDPERAASIARRGLFALARARAGRVAAACVPGLGGVLCALDAARGIEQSVRFVSAVEREAEAACRRIVVLRPARRAPFAPTRFAVAA